VDDDALKRIATIAEELDVPIHMHLHETTREIDEHIGTYGMRPMERLNRLGLLSPRLIAVHMTTLSDDEISEVAKLGVNVAHCPESNLKLASGFCPLQKLLDQGVNVGIGTDGAASNNDLDMFGEIRTAALLAKGVSQNACAAAAPDILRLATRGAAKALGREHELGSLEPGKLADIVAVDLGQTVSQPLYDVISQIIYAGHRDQVNHVWVGGRTVVKDGELTLIDESAVKMSARNWQKKISATTNAR